jgi:hypothetical protein
MFRMGLRIVGAMIVLLASAACTAPAGHVKATEDRVAVLDVEYLRQLNEQVAIGKITEGDRRLLWDAYLVRLQATSTPCFTMQPKLAWPIVNSPGF